MVDGRWPSQGNGVSRRGRAARAELLAGGGSPAPAALRARRDLSRRQPDHARQSRNVLGVAGDLRARRDADLWSHMVAAISRFVLIGWIALIASPALAS